MLVEHLAMINAARHARRAVIVVTDLDSGVGQVIGENEITDGELKASVDKAFRSGRSGRLEIGGKRLFLNVLVPPPRIVVIGAVHISQALAAMAPVAGYDLRIVDPRTGFATPERFRGIGLIAEWPEDALRQHPLDPYTAMVAVTHEPRIDDLPLIEAIRAGCFYVGALGSRKTHAKRVDRLQAEGLTDAQIARIDAPIGLDIGAQSPAEIAVSILGAVVQAFRQRDLRGADSGD